MTTLALLLVSLDASAEPWTGCEDPQCFSAAQWIDVSDVSFRGHVLSIERATLLLADERKGTVVQVAIADEYKGQVESDLINLWLSGDTYFTFSEGSELVVAGALMHPGHDAKCTACVDPPLGDVLVPVSEGAVFWPHEAGGLQSSSAPPRKCTNEDGEFYLGIVELHADCPAGFTADLAALAHAFSSSNQTPGGAIIPGVISNETQR